MQQKSAARCKNGQHIFVLNAFHPTSKVVGFPAAFITKCILSQYDAIYQCLHRIPAHLFRPFPRFRCTLKCVEPALADYCFSHATTRYSCCRWWTAYTSHRFPVPRNNSRDIIPNQFLVHHRFIFWTSNFSRVAMLLSMDFCFIERAYRRPQPLIEAHSPQTLRFGRPDRTVRLWL